MKNAQAACAVLFMTTASLSTALAQTTLETGGDAMTVSSAPPDAVVIRHPYLSHYVHSNTGTPGLNTGAEMAGNPLSPALERLRLAGPWLNLLRDDAHEDWERGSCYTSTSDGFCRLRWRKSDGFTQLRSRLDDLSRTMKTRVVGRSLADHLEVDIDSSPEIKMKWDWD